ncbi:hypothetical protein SDC9_143295 [bioreactor metagenome]|uniref:Uncharacterized protein n=1 Tax=bioreactor metagenome TaxID=1076179 RepID=A0A645E416_9ZZZZ
MCTLALVCSGGTLNGPVVGFGAAGDKIDFARLCMNGRGDLCSGFVDSLFAFFRNAVEG